MDPVLDHPEVSDKTKRKRIWRIIIIAVLSTFICPLLVLAGRAFLPKLWGDIHVINFVVNWLPAVLSILVAFVPDHELERRARISWRVAVIVCGVFYSLALWHQQLLADQANAQTQRQILAQSVLQANKHADQQFGRVNTEVAQLDNALTATQQRLIDTMNKADAALDASIGKVAKPTPPVPAMLTFTLWNQAVTIAHPPLMETFAKANDDGTYSVDFTVINGSQTTAKGIDIWVQICDACTFAKEPNLFEHPAGSDSRIRHARLGDLNPGVSFQEMTVMLKVPAASMFQVGFRYSCETCGGTAPVGHTQIATIYHTFYGPPAVGTRLSNIYFPPKHP